MNVNSTKHTITSPALIMEKTYDDIVSISGLFEMVEQQKDDICFFRACVRFAQRKCDFSYNEDTKKWETILTRIMTLLAASNQIGDERIMLASYAFCALYSKLYSSHECSKLLIDLLQKESDAISLFSIQYYHKDIELFKLNIIYGYLLTNQFADSSGAILYKIIFNTLYGHCIKYTKYTYFAYKLLYKWLVRTVDSKFWSESNSDGIEKKMEAVIFSNWNNSISQISVQNSSIFGIYLNIMKNKYDGFLEFLFQHCVDNMSWQNEIKYVILSVICNSADNTSNMLSKDFTLSLFTSLTNNNLKASGTKLYTAIIKNLPEKEWKELFGDPIKFVLGRWESGPNKNHDAIQLLCKHWLEPAIIRHRSVFTFLWTLSKDVHCPLFHSYLHRMASELRIDLAESPVYYGNHENEIVRLNAFAADCCRFEKLLNATNDEPLMRQKEFLWYNANASTTVMRMGIIKYFNVFYTNLLRASETSDNNANYLCNFTTWVYEYFLDCFEIGSCYQRKVLALNLYNTILLFTDASDNTAKRGNTKERSRLKAIIEKRLMEDGKWNFTDKKMLVALLKLVLDTEEDTRDLATNTIISYFHESSLTKVEKEKALEAALRNCNSSKFYEIESGAALIKILSHWSFFDTGNIIGYDLGYGTYSEVLLHLAEEQFTFVKQDILKAALHEKPFYGALTALLQIAFQNGPESKLPKQNLARKILLLLDDSVNFFLSVLSSHSANAEHSSSFEEVGLAINETIKTSELHENANIDELSTSSAHQIVLLCIWMSLRVSCELASEIGMLMHSKDAVTSCLNVIVSVLIRCRHKGAIEFAGTALGNLTRRLFNTEEYCDLPTRHVIDLLKSGDVDAGKHITRRGAGLTIMFHKLVASDNRKGRPILHFVLNELLNSLKYHTEIIDKDSILSRHLHFLRALVADKELSTQVISYMEHISQMCFLFLQDQRWTVRNASLQLFGAVVPRLVGQTRGGRTLDFGNGYSVDHFTTHYPTLAGDISKELGRFTGDSCTHMLTRDVLVSSNIMPILILLSNFSCGGCDLIDYSSENFIKDAKTNLRVILCNDVERVRCAAAKAYAALTPYPHITTELERLMSDILPLKNINSLHGHLLAVHYLRKKLFFEGDTVNVKCRAGSFINNSQWNLFTGISRLHNISRYYSDIIDGKTKRHPNYILETLFLNNSNLLTSLTDSTSIESIISQCKIVTPMERIKPGFFEFVNILMELYAERVKCIGITNTKVIEEILECDYMIEVFLSKLSIYEPLLETILSHISSALDRPDERILKVMISFAIDTLKESTISSSQVSYLQKIQVGIIERIPEQVTRMSLLRLKFILTLMFSSNESISDILQSIFNLCLNKEESFRCIAVECIGFSLKRFTEMDTNNKLLIVHCCLILLKDEIFEIRDATAQHLRENKVFPFNAENTMIHNEIIYQRLLWEVVVGQSLFQQVNPVENVNFITKFVEVIMECKSANIIENPFECENDALYREGSKFLNIILLGLDLRSKRNHCLMKTVNSIQIFNSRYEMEKRIGFNNCGLNAVLNLKYMSYLFKKQQIVLQECYFNV